MWYGRESVYREKFQDPMGIFFTQEEFPELADEKEDVSGILQGAVNRLVQEQQYGILYIPEGEYPLKDMVKIPPSVRLIGYGRKRPVFVLPPFTAGFDGKAKKAPGFMEAFMEGYPGAKYLFWFIGEKNTESENPKDANGATFYSALSNIDFRIEEGNPGAVCIRAHFAQHGFISHCHFDLGDGLAGLFDVGNEMEDLTFSGGAYGIVCRMTSPGWPFVLLDSVFEGQRKAAVLSATTGFTGFRLKISDTPKAFSLYIPEAWEKLYLEDCVFENISDAAVTFYHTESVIQQTNLLRIFCRQTPVFVKKEENEQTVCGVAEAYKVEEYAYGYMYGDTQEASHQEIFEAYPVEEIPAMPAGDIPPVPPMEKWVSVAGYGAKGDGVTDDTEALRRALSQESVLYFPQGIYKVTDTVTMKKNCTIIGLSPITTQIVIEDDTPEFAGFGAPKAVLETAQGGFAYVSGIGIDTAGKNPRAAGIKWMAGASSYMNDVKFVGGHGLMFRDGRNAYAYLYNAGRTADYNPDRIWDYQYSSLWITKGGGGVFKDIWSASPYAESGIAITDTDTPGRMYAVSLEHHVRNELKLYRVKNWSFYALQTEEEKAEGMECLPIEMVSCENIAFGNLYMFRVVAVDRSYDTGIRLWDCRQIRFLNIHNKAQMQYVFTTTVRDTNTGFYGKSPEYAKLVIEGGNGHPAFKTAGDYEIVAEGFDFAQGAAFDEEGNLYWCDKSLKKIFCFNPKKRLVLPFYDIHFIPSALAVDTAGNLLAAVDYSELKKTVPGQPYMSHDTSNFHPFFSWFYKRSEKVYSVSLKDPYNTMTPLEKTDAKNCSPQTVYRPQQLSYYGMLREIVEKPVEACYMAPDKKTALEGTIDLARSLLLGAAVRGQTFYMTDDQSRKIYAFDVTSGGNLANGTCVGAKGQYGVMQGRDQVLWTVDDRLYAFKDGKIVAGLDVPEDAYAVVGKDGAVYIMGRSHIYRSIKGF